MLLTIASHFKGDKYPEAHDRLQLQAQNTKIRRNESMEDYLKRYAALQRKMIAAEYPGIDNERTSVIFAVRDLQVRPSLAPHEPLLLIQRPETLRELERTVDLLATVEKPSRRHPRGHRGMTWPAPVRQSWSWREHPQPTTAPPPRGRGRDRGRHGQRFPHHCQYRQGYQRPWGAYATEEVEPATEWPARDISTDYATAQHDPRGGAPINNEPYDLYWFDSACAPSYTTRRPPIQAQSTLAARLPNGAVMAARIPDRTQLELVNRTRVPIGKLAFIPQLHHNLLSMDALTKVEKSTVVFNAPGGAIIDGMIDLTQLPVMEHIERDGPMFAIHARPQLGAVSNGVEPSRTHRATRITEYFKQRKEVHHRRKDMNEAVQPLPLLAARRQQPHRAQRTERVPERSKDRNMSTVRLPQHIQHIRPQVRKQIDTAHT